MITEAASFSFSLLKRCWKNCGMVALFKCCVMTRVRRPSTAQASNEPRNALPIPAQVAATPYFQPN